MKITVTKEITSKLPFFRILAYTMKVKVESSLIVEETIKRLEKKFQSNFSLEDVLNISAIKEARDGYKKLGKDPSRYRLACESLIRRLVKKNSLYRINNVVDCGNILSLELGRSTAVLDRDKIVGNVRIRLGTNEDEYYGIGRGLLNVSNIPLYVDDISPFGSPTSDTERTAVGLETKNILLMIICFSENNLEEAQEKAQELFTKYAYALNITNVVVEYE